MNETSKILIRGDGIGDIDLSLVEKRADELARSDGREGANETDVEQALEALSGGETHEAPELVPGTELLMSWDESPMEHGVHTENLAPDDELNVVEELFLQGAEEADHDLRVVAVEGFSEEPE